MKTLSYIYIIAMLVASGLTTICQAQSKFKPKYLRENSKDFLSLTSQATDNGWLFFRKDIEGLKSEEFFARFGDNIGLGKGRLSFSSVCKQTAS